MHLYEDDISKLRKGAAAFISTFKKSKHPRGSNPGEVLFLAQDYLVTYRNSSPHELNYGFKLTQLQSQGMH
jgi:hypothetical protein